MATQPLLKLLPKIFLAVPLVLDLVVSRLFIYFVKMFGTSGGQESPTVSAENEVLLQDRHCWSFVSTSFCHKHSAARMMISIKN